MTSGFKHPWSAVRQQRGLIKNQSSVGLDLTTTLAFNLASSFNFSFSFSSFYFFAQQSCQTVFLNCLYLLLLCIGLQYSLARKTDSRLEDFNQYYCQGGISQQRLSAEYKFYHQLKWEQLSLVDQKNNVSICQPHLQSHYSDPP